MPPTGLDNLKHLVVLMMENRSFDHMFGGLKASHPGIDTWPAGYTNPDTQGNEIAPQAKAEYQGQLDPDPNHDFAPINEQIFNGGQTPDMRGFIRSYFKQRKDVKSSRRILYYFTPSQLPVLSNLALEYTVFNRWFASIPGPTLCNRAFAHYGTSFGHVGMEMKYLGHAIKSVYERLHAGGRTTKLYYFDRASSTLELINLLKDQPQIFATYEQFLADCHAGTLPDYSFVEPNYSDHDGLIASDQHPDHHVAEGERFIASIYMAIKSNPALWPNTAFLITYDEHGGTFDHVSPPSPDGKDDDFEAPADKTGTGQPFKFDRLGIRVPAILVSPWVKKGLVVNEVYEHGVDPSHSDRVAAARISRTENRPRDESENVPSLAVRADDAHGRPELCVALSVMSMPPIKMPATPRSAYDPTRPANALLLSQVRELEKALVQAGRDVRRKKPKTEGQVAAYIRHLNRALHHQMLLPAMKRRRLDVPLDGETRRPSRRKSRPAARQRAGAATRRKGAAHSRKGSRRS